MAGLGDLVEDYYWVPALVLPEGDKVADLLEVEFLISRVYYYYNILLQWRSRPYQLLLCRIFLAEFFTLDLYTDFDLDPPTLDDGTCGV